MDTKVQDFIQANQLPEERFLPVLNFEGRFWISDHGRIVSHDHRKNTIAFLSPYLDSQGYRNTQLRKKPENRKCRVHQLVGEHYCIMDYVPGSWMVWNHKDGNKLNNHYLNLEFVTTGQNITHAIEVGLFDTKGENHHNSILTKENILSIRQMRTTGMTHKQIGKVFGVNRRTIGDVINGKCWEWLTQA